MFRPVTVLVGFLLLLLGAWIAIVPFVGPMFSFGIRHNTSWQWTQTNLVLDVLPGAAVFFGGLLIMTGMRASASLGGLIALCGGGWSVLGPSTYHVALMTMLRQYGYYYAAGGLAIAMAAYAMGRASVPRVVATDADTTTAAASEPTVVTERVERPESVPTAT